MNFLPIVVTAVAAVGLASVAVAQALDIPSLLTEGQLAYQKGDLERAKSAFELVYRMDSRNPVAIGYLRRIKVDEANRPKGNEQEKQLSTVIIPQIQFRDATLGSALDYLKKVAQEQTGGRQVVNFVVQLPPQQVNSQTVTLNLTSVPFTEAVRYLADLAGATVVYDRYAIMLKPKSGAPAPAAAPLAQ